MACPVDWKNPFKWEASALEIWPKAVVPRSEASKLMLARARRTNCEGAAMPARKLPLCTP